MFAKSAPVFRYFFLDLAGSVPRFPVWWYTDGFFGVLGWIRRSLAYRWQSYNMAVWMKNFFVPMYGQYDLAGRLVSVFMRFIVFIGRLVALCVEAVVYLLLAALWLISLPALVFLFIQGIVQAA
jgi:hypothetical protein